jgi:hypothetical protein
LKSGRKIQRSFKHDSEEIESITLDPDHVFPDSNEANNVWTAKAKVIEKTTDSFSRNYSNA